MINIEAHRELNEAFQGTAVPEFDKRIVEADPTKDASALIEAIVEKMKLAEEQLNVHSKPVPLAEGVEVKL